MRTKLVGECSVCRKTVDVLNRWDFLIARKHNSGGEMCRGSFEDAENPRIAAMKPYKARP